MPYGCFVEIMPGKDGLLHISEIDWKRLETVEEAGIKEGDKIQVKLLDIDPKTGKYKLSRRCLLEKPEDMSNHNVVHVAIEANVVHVVKIIIVHKLVGKDNHNMVSFLLMSCK